MTRSLVDKPRNRTALLAPAALVAVGLLTWLDWSRREPRLQARTAARLRTTAPRS